MKVYHKKFQSVSTQNQEIDAKIEALAEAAHQFIKDLDELGEWASKEAAEAMRPFSPDTVPFLHFGQSNSRLRQLLQLSKIVRDVRMFTDAATTSVEHETWRLEKRQIAIAEVFGFQLPDDLIDDPNDCHVPF